MSNELRQPPIAAQVCEIVHALSPGRVQNHETLHERGFVVARSRSLTATCCCTLPGSPRERNACTTSGIPPRAVKVSSSGWGSTSNSNGDSVGEGFGIRRMPAIVRESHTLRVRIPEHACSLVVAAFMLYPWAQTPA